MPISPQRVSPNRPPSRTWPNRNTGTCLVVESPATSSPGLAFLLGTVAHFGEDGWQSYWTQLKDNGVKVTGGWTDAYTVDFSGSSGKGARPLVVSYASSPPAEVPDW